MKNNDTYRGRYTSDSDCPNDISRLLVVLRHGIYNLL